MAKKIFLQIDGKPKGPFTLSQIKQLATSGKISAETLGSPEVNGQPSQQWRKIGLIKIYLEKLSQDLSPVQPLQNLVRLPNLKHHPH